MPNLRSLALITVLMFAICLPSHARRIALVVGNDAYQQIDALKNARNDAEAMARELQKVGFTVARATDVNRDGLHKAIDAFVAQVGKDDEAVFYYAGHGVQIDASPYLLPVDVRADSARQLVRDALPLESLLADLSRARYALVIVDACRNNPFMTRGVRSIGSERGLNPIEPPEGMAVIMSAGRGQTALDSLGPGDKSPNGLFAREFIRLMSVPGMQVRDLLLQVRDSVEKNAATIAHKQRPALIDESRGQFYFVPAETGRTQAVPVAENNAIELAFWNSVQDSSNVDELKLYLQRYPQGMFAELATVRIARLQTHAKDPVPGAVAGAGALAGNPEARRQMDLAQRGNAGAMAQLGNFYRDGRQGLTRDFALAKQWYEKGADLGNLDALSGLATLYERGWGVAADPAHAVVLYKRAAEGGDSCGMNNLGLAYAAGIGGLQRDLDQALAWYRRAAAIGNTFSMTNIGGLYASGKSVPRDDAEAVKWYQRAVAGGGALGMWKLADMYLTGRGGLSRDYGKAAELYRRVAEKGESAGFNGLAVLHLNGWGVVKDDAMAVQMYRKSMDLDDPRGIAGTGLMHQLGRGGLTQDLTKARELYERAAARNDNLALSNIAFFHLNGWAGVPKDPAKGVELLTRAADRDYARAMFHLGGIYKEGRFVPQDMQASRRWYERAASFGDEAAKKELGPVNTSSVHQRRARS